MADPSTGEAAGILAGVVAVLVAVGHAIRWALGWTDRLAATRAAKLDAWQRQLDAREAKLDQAQAEYQRRIEWRLTEVTASTEALQREQAAWKAAYLLTSVALRIADRDNPALRLSDDLLRTAFLPDPITPDDMICTVLKAQRRTDDPPTK